MKCPKCTGKLAARSLGEMQIDSCPVCEGIWFDAGELEEFLKEGSPYFAAIRASKEQFDGKEVRRSGANFDQSRGTCPRCVDTTYMLRQPHPQNASFVVDVCPRGHGVWLDGGELLTLGGGGVAAVSVGEKAGKVVQLLRGLFSK